MCSPAIASRRVGAATAALLTGSVMLAPAALAQEGPGYGGTADGLSVSWTEPDRLVAMGAPGTTVELSASNLALDVFGLGFRGRSEVVVTVGTNAPVTTRVDPTGTLDLSVGLEKLEAGPQPGTSVVVLGRAPAGTSRTLVGAVPPVPSGTGPADLIPWIVGVVLAVAGGLGLRGRRRRAPVRAGF
jgi:hypothetical protein